MKHKHKIQWKILKERSHIDVRVLLYGYFKSLDGSCGLNLCSLGQGSAACTSELLNEPLFP